MGTMRHEFKHLIHMGDYLAIRSRLKHIMKQDAHVDQTGHYFIRSLYFDNYADKALMEKLNGFSVREKYRLRYYNYDGRFVNLEKKSKNNQLGTKDSATLTREQCQQLLDGHWEFMRNSNNPVLIEFYSKLYSQQLRPKTIVDYIREPYVYEAGNVRVTFDSQIRTGLYSQDFFSDAVPTMPALEKGYFIMEVKYDNYLPEVIASAIQTGQRQSSAFSKYAACRQYE